MCEHKQKYYVNKQVDGRMVADSVFCGDCDSVLYDSKGKGNFVNQPVEVQKDTLEQVEQICDSGERKQFSTGAVRDMQEGKGAPSYMPMDALLRLSVHYERGAKKYGAGNYLRGIPLSSFLNSAIRHIWKYIQGRDEEDHLAAASFNILGAMQMEATKPEMLDIPNRQGKNKFEY